MNEGFVYVWRKIREKGYYTKSAYVHLWLHLLLLASYKEKEFLWNGEMKKLKPGQFVTGRHSLSIETGIPSSTVEDILNTFETQHQIRQQKTNKFRLISILNWETYQNSDSNSDNKATTKRQQSDTINKDNKGNKEDNNTAELNSADIVEMISCFKEVNPAFKKWYANKTQRAALGRLLETNGKEKLQKIIKLLPRSNGMEYMPVITTPLQLEDKIAQLASAWQKIKNKEPIIL